MKKQQAKERGNERKPETNQWINKQNYGWINEWMKERS